MDVASWPPMGIVVVAQLLWVVLSGALAQAFAQVAVAIVSLPLQVRPTWMMVAMTGTFGSVAEAAHKLHAMAIATTTPTWATLEPKSVRAVVGSAHLEQTQQARQLSQTRRPTTPMELGPRQSQHLQHRSRLKKSNRKRRRSRRRKRRRKLRQQTKRRKTMTRARMILSGPMPMVMDAKLTTNTLIMVDSPRKRLASTTMAVLGHTAGKLATLVTPWAAQPRVRTSSVCPSGILKQVSATHAKIGPLSVPRTILLLIALSHVANVSVQAQQPWCQPLQHLKPPPPRPL